MTSLAPPSPHLCRAKRGRRSADFGDFSPSGKRHRCTLGAESLDTAGHLRSARHRLQTLFPDMDEKVITSVLDSCQGDLDEALEKLTELSLTTNSSPTAENAERVQATTQHQSPVASVAQRKHSTQFKQGKAEPHENASPPSADEVELWAVALSEEATAATDKQDLQRRIFNFLTLCKQHIEGKQAEAHATHMSDLRQQNAVLKKAVAIQHTRITKHNADKEAQLAELQGLLQASQQRIAALEASNYALSLHLKHATDGSPSLGRPPPDVF